MAEAGNAAGKAEVVGKVTNEAEEAAYASRAAREAEETAEAKHKRTCPEDPIDIAAGAMLFEAVDIELPGPISLSWTRT